LDLGIQQLGPALRTLRDDVVKHESIFPPKEISVDHVLELAAMLASSPFQQLSNVHDRVQDKVDEK
jgi:hypothetical protein